MARIRDTNFYVTNGWMITRLGLSGRELQVYAIIYGFTQDMETEFNGSLNYIAEWLGTTNRTTVTRALKGLIEKGLITKRQTAVDGVITNYYKAVLPPPPQKTGSTKTVQGSTETVQGQYQNGTKSSTETVQGGSTETVPNKDIYKNNNINNIQGGLASPQEKNTPVPYRRIVDTYNDLCKSFPKCVSISENRKKAIAARWREYGGNIAVFYRLFVMAEESDFLKGKNDRNWSATFDWLLKSANMTKVLEGKYSNKDSNKGGSTHGQAYASTKPAEAWAAEASEYPDFDAMFG